MKKYSFKSIAYAIISAMAIAPMMPMMAYAAPTDSSSPTVSILTPSNGASLSGVVSIAANASDAFSSCVIRIFGQYYDVSVLGSTHTGGNVFNCGNNQDALYLSQHGTNVNRIVPYLVPSAFMGVTKFELYVDGSLVATNNMPVGPTSTIAYLWNTTTTFSWNSATVSNGSHNIQVKVSDGTNIASSGSVSITTSNSVITPPTSIITDPPTASTVSGTIMVAADATGVPSVAKVEFYVDGVLKLTDITSPYSFSWDTTQVVNGTHTLQAKAYDPASNVGNSSPITVTVNNSTTTPPPTDTTAPSVSITSPLNGATVLGSITVSANAADANGVTKVEFYVDGALASTDTSSAYSFVLNTTLISNGSHTLQAKAYDNAGNVGTSGSITVNVNNSTTQNPPPTTTPGSHLDDDNDDDDENEVEIHRSEREHSRTPSRTETRRTVRSSRSDD